MSKVKKLKQKKKIDKAMKKFLVSENLIFENDLLPIGTPEMNILDLLPIMKAEVETPDEVEVLNSFLKDLGELKI